MAEGENEATVMARILKMAPEERQERVAALRNLQQLLYDRNKQTALHIFQRILQP